MAKDGTMLEGEMAQIRASTVQQKSEDMYAALQDAATFHCQVAKWHVCDDRKPKPKEKRTFVDKNTEATKHRTEWCAAASKYRCLRCGWSSKKMKLARGNDEGLT